MKLNCDMGESFGPWSMGMDEEVMPWIDMANVACGFHASDPDTMAKTVRLAVQHSVTIGAHPSYDDKVGFGRRSIPHSLNQIKHLVAYQAGALDAICRQYGAQVSYIKPHGALYNDMMANKGIFEAVVGAVASLPYTNNLMMLAKSDMSEFDSISASYGVTLIKEAFADRAYTDEGSLMPRSREGAVLKDNTAIEAQVLQLAKEGTITSHSGKTLTLNVDTICVHGDNDHSVAMIEQLKKALTG
ncbi:hypothetical protein CS022_16970 [Veronia nyctiphanis]|uniref:LamB/YcsF family protein n=1 Tax=Veronia nyctiphanis TaxID=1278244 RepID=A0A4V1LSM7_9GAMM|nr:5-oxoprolinase subunit PxpA [Veronia nyctiphanis]RXJ72238.1 hypothetical protein CS022_16970 [Veronia nyctiphanis]